MSDLKIPKEHQLKCEGCGQILDMRDISVLGHGWIEDGEIKCYDTEEKVSYSGSKKQGSEVYYTNDKKEINLN